MNLGKQAITTTTTSVQAFPQLDLESMQNSWSILSLLYKLQHVCTRTLSFTIKSGKKKTTKLVYFTRYGTQFCVATRENYTTQHTHRSQYRPFLALLSLFLFLLVFLRIFLVFLFSFFRFLFWSTLRIRWWIRRWFWITWTFRVTGWGRRLVSFLFFFLGYKSEQQRFRYQTVINTSQKNQLWKNTFSQAKHSMCLEVGRKVSNILCLWRRSKVLNLYCQKFV